MVNSGAADEGSTVTAWLWGAASAFPPNYYPQHVLCSALTNYWADQLPHPKILSRLHANACVDGRYLARPIEDYYRMSTFGDFNETWIDTAEQLGSQALYAGRGALKALA